MTLRLDYRRRGANSVAICIAFLLTLMFVTSSVLSSLTVVAEKDKTFGYIISGNRVSVWTPFYNMTLNLSEGINIEKVYFYNGEFTLDLTPCIRGISSLGFYIFTKGTPKGALVHLGNKTYRLPYLSSLSSGSWSAEVLRRTNSSITFILRPSAEALSDVKPLDVLVELKVHYYSPTIELNVTITNPSEGPVKLLGLRIDNVTYGPGVGLLACPMLKSGWDQRILYIDKGELRVKTLNIENLSAVIKKSNIKALALTRPKGLPWPSEVLELRPVSPAVENVSGFTNIKLEPVEGNEKPKNVSIYSIIALYSPRELRPKDHVSYVFDLVLAHVTDPASLFIYDLNDLYYAMNKEAFSYDASQVLKFKELQENLSSLKALNEDLKNEVSELKSRCDNLTKSLEETLGKLNYFMTNYHILENSISDLNSRLRKCSLAEMIVLVVGIIVGVVGGWIIHSIKSSKFRRR